MRSTSIGREALFEEVYWDCLRDVRLYARAHVGRDHEDDVVSSTFMAVWRRLDDLPAQSHRAWVLGVCRNVCRNRLRSERRFAALVEEVVAARPRLELQLSADGMDVDALASLLGVLPTMTADDRELFVLTAWMGMTPSEIAEVLGVPPGRVRVRLHRLRAALASHLHGGTVRGGVA